MQKIRNKLNINQKENVQYIQYNEYYAAKSGYGCKHRKKLATNSSCLRGGDLVDREVERESCFHNKPFCSFTFWIMYTYYLFIKNE